MLIRIVGMSVSWSGLSERQSDRFSVIKGLGGFGRKITNQELWRLTSWVLLPCCFNSLCYPGKISSLLWVSVFPSVEWEHAVGQSRGLWCSPLLGGLGEAHFVFPWAWAVTPLSIPLPFGVNSYLLVFIYCKMVGIKLTVWPCHSR